MRGNLKKQLSSLALLVLLLAAVSIPVMATNSDDGATDLAGDYVPPDDGLSNVTDVPADGGLVSGLPADDAIVTALDENVSDGTQADAGVDVPAADEEVYYATAYGANCHWTPAATPACAEQKPVDSPCAAAANTTGCASKACCKSAIQASVTACD